MEPLCNCSYSTLSFGSKTLDLSLHLSYAPVSLKRKTGTMVKMLYFPKCCVLTLRSS